MPRFPAPLARDILRQIEFPLRVDLPRSCPQPPRRLESHLNGRESQPSDFLREPLLAQPLRRKLPQHSSRANAFVRDPIRTTRLERSQPRLLRALEVRQSKSAGPLPA